MTNFPINFLSLARLASGSGRVVKHKTHDPEGEGSNPADGTRRAPLELCGRKWQKNLEYILTPSFLSYRQGVLFYEKFSHHFFVFGNRSFWGPRYKTFLRCNLFHADVSQSVCYNHLLSSLSKYSGQSPLGSTLKQDTRIISSPHLNSTLAFKYCTRTKLKDSDKRSSLQRFGMTFSCKKSCGRGQQRGKKQM